MAAKLITVPAAEPQSLDAAEPAPVTPFPYPFLRRTAHERGGYHLFYRLLEAFWLVVSHVLTRTLTFGSTRQLLQSSIAIYRTRLEKRLGPPLPSFGELGRQGLLGQKHIAFAAYMATLSTLPILGRRASTAGLMRAVLAKTSLGASTKLLDNLNDRLQGLEEATRVLRDLKGVMTTGRLEQAPGTAPSRGAELVGLELAKWVFEGLGTQPDHPAVASYKSDVVKLVTGQVDSLGHKSAEQQRPSVARYLARIAEKSIGDVWLDIDLCLLEEAHGSLRSGQRAALERLKRGNDLVFKSSLLYDDAQDLLEDLQTNSVNVCTLLGIERGAITENDLERLTPPQLYALLRKARILQMTVKLADTVYLSGIRAILSAKKALRGLVDVDALLLGYRFVRLFNLRKLVEERPDLRNITEFLSSLLPFSCIQGTIPQALRSYERVLVPVHRVDLHTSYS